MIKHGRKPFLEKLIPFGWQGPRLISNPLTYQPPNLRPLSKPWLHSKYLSLKGLFCVRPDFIIGGCPKCGTTSLYEYLIQHSDIYPGRKKELYFFDRNFSLKFNWYKGNFQFSLYKNFKQKMGKAFLTGESTPTYYRYPYAAPRIHDELSNVKLIFLCRNPIDRAYSHYQMNRRFEYETLTFEDAINFENARLQGEREKMNKDMNYFSFIEQNYGYLSHGIYVSYMKDWFTIFRKKNILVIKTEDMNENPQEIVDKTFEFLELPAEKIKIHRHNPGEYSSMSNHTRKRLASFFEPYNKQFYELLGKDMDWK